jgi:type I restriction enzyme S subunit
VPTAKLVDVAELNPPLAASLSDGDGVSFMPMAAVDASSVTAVDRETRLYSEVCRGYTPFLDGDVLVAKITPCFENGKIAQARLSRRYGFGSTEFHVVRPHSDQADARYLVHFLRQDSIRKQGESRMTGSAGQRRVPVNFLAGLTIPLPPLPEQRRIAEILDKADALRAKRRAALTQLDTLTQSIFLDMFGDPATNPKGWPVAALKNCVTEIQIGPFGSLLHQEDYVVGGIPLVNPKHIQGGVIEIGKDETVTLEKYHELRVYHLAPGDVVMGRRGEMGRCAIVDAASCPLLCGTGSLFLRSDNAHTTSLFLRAMLSSEAIKSRLERLSLGQTLPNLNSRIVEGLEIPLPPVTVQRDFAGRVMASKALEALQQNSLAWLDALFASLQHRAFRGEL